MSLLMNFLPTTTQPTSFFFILSNYRPNPKFRSLVPATSHVRFTCYDVQINDPIDTKYQEKQRRSANYKPPIWDYEQLLSLKNNEYSGQMYIERSNVMKEQVKIMLDQEMKPLCQLDLIDDLQRLGIYYHFEEKINSILRRIYIERIKSKNKGLYETALEFRLLRQHNFHVPQEVFDGFRCENGDFKASLKEDMKGLLHLYEASFLLIENEKTLELAREFTIKHLKKNLEEKRVDSELKLLVEHAIEVPLHWRVLRLEARWFIDVYEKRPNINPNLLEFAKLDFNILQAIYKIDLDHAIRWWKSTGFAERLRFARDRLVENFFWTTGVIFNPEYGYCRRMLTEVNSLVTTIDDIYDVYGTIEELQLFTDAVERWDAKAVDQLPYYMKICYLALYNFVSKMAYDALKEQEAYIIPHLCKAWADLCRAYLQEAKWYFSGYIPTLEEYLNNAWISISAPAILTHAYFLVSNPIKEAIDILDEYRNIIRCSSMILRLSDDLGTSSEELKRGDVPKSIQCYMKETGASEEEAREYIKLLISETWKKLNKERVRETNVCEIFIGIAINLGRMAQCIYENGDGHGHQDSVTTQRILALLFNPIHIVIT